MRITAQAKTLNDLIKMIGLSQVRLAEIFDYSIPYMSLRCRGLRPWFKDELERLAWALNTQGKTKTDISMKEIAEFLGPDRLKDRRFKPKGGADA